MMHALDDIDERLRQAARPDEAAVDRVTRGALASVARPRRITRALPVAALLLCLLALAAWWTRRTTTVTLRFESTGDGVSLQAADGTTWIYAGALPREYLPPGSCVVIGAGETP